MDQSLKSGPEKTKIRSKQLTPPPWTTNHTHGSAWLGVGGFAKSLKCPPPMIIDRLAHLSIQTPNGGNRSRDKAPGRKKYEIKRKSSLKHSLPPINWFVLFLSFYLLIDSEFFPLFADVFDDLAGLWSWTVRLCFGCSISLHFLCYFFRPTS